MVQKCQKNNKGLQFGPVSGIAKGISLQLMSGSDYYKKVGEV